MKILVSNVGSTSLKCKLMEMPQERVLCEVRLERVGSETSAIYTYTNCLSGWSIREENLCVPSYGRGIALFLRDAAHPAHGVIRAAEEIEAIGFKTVLSRGYYGVHELTREVMEGMRSALFVAPVHNAAYLEAVECFRQTIPDARRIGVFETAFHTTVPLERRLYGVPYEWYERYGLMRMGYHGASHAYIADQAAQSGRGGRVISCHLGGSCSLCAIENGKSVDTSFGFSLQTGVMHANRCGDADAYLVPYLMQQGLTMDEVLEGLSKRGGLLGLSGVSNDLREVEQAAAQGNRRAELAIRTFVNGIVRYIGAFYAELGGLDQLVFTGGIGENSARIRTLVCAPLTHMGVVLDESKNAGSRAGVISADGAAVTVCVIPANEELGVARQTYRYIEQGR